jgi:hypothetical protein
MRSSAIIGETGDIIGARIRHLALIAAAPADGGELSGVLSALAPVEEVSAAPA